MLFTVDRRVLDGAIKVLVPFATATPVEFHEGAGALSEKVVLEGTDGGEVNLHAPSLDVSAEVTLRAPDVDDVRAGEIVVAARLLSEALSVVRDVDRVGIGFRPDAAAEASEAGGGVLTVVDPATGSSIVEIAAHSGDLIDDEDMNYKPPFALDKASFRADAQEFAEVMEATNLSNSQHGTLYQDCLEFLGGDGPVRVAVLQQHSMFLGVRTLRSAEVLSPFAKLLLPVSSARLAARALRGVDGGSIIVTADDADHTMRFTALDDDGARVLDVVVQQGTEVSGSGDGVTGAQAALDALAPMVSSGVPGRFTVDSQEFNTAIGDAMKISGLMNDYSANNYDALGYVHMQVDFGGEEVAVQSAHSLNKFTRSLGMEECAQGESPDLAVSVSAAVNQDFLRGRFFGSPKVLNMTIVSGIESMGGAVIGVVLPEGVSVGDDGYPADIAMFAMTMIDDRKGGAQ